MRAKLARRSVLGLSLMLGASFIAPAWADDAKPIRIGWLSSLTGPLSSAAIAENIGVQFAVDEINAAGGIDGRKLELVTRDTMGDPTKAVNFAQQLAFNEKVDFVIGPVNSGESLAATPILARAGIPQIVIGTVDELTNPKLYPRAFRAIATNSQWVKGANDYVLDKLKLNKIAIIGDTTGYGTATVKQAEAMLKERGVTPVYSVLIDANKADLTDEIGKAKAAGAEVIMTWSAATGLLGRILNTRGEMGWDVPVVGHPALMGTPIRDLLNKPEYWDNTYASGYASMTIDENGKFPERTQQLMDAVKPKLGGKIDFTFWWIALGYDAVKILEHAIKKAGSTDPAAVQKALEETQGLELVYTTYSWGPDDRNGFPDEDIVINLANTFTDGGFKKAPHQ
jgi:branched-chain amino acid transport system substrate-binding protein